MGFVAKDKVQPLDYDLRPHLDVSGTVPEPSSDQVDRYWHVMGQIMKAEQDRLRAEAREAEKDRGDDEDVDVMPLNRYTIADTLAGMDPERLAEQKGKVVAALADLCSGQPSAEQLGQLPHRVLQAFAGWLTGEISPEVSAAATRP